MYRWMRNAHLALGLSAFVMAALFFVSSLGFSYREELASEPDVRTRSVAVPADQAPDPRGLALTLIRDHGLRGGFQGAPRNDEERFDIRIGRPGTRYDVSYDRATGRADIVETRQGFLRTTMVLHHLHGLNHADVASIVWAVLGFLTALGMTLLGVSGVYLWFQTYSERRLGAAILTVGLLWGLGSLLWMRL